MQSRDVAHIIIETTTPLRVGSNASDFLQDSPIQRDFNGLPMILGSSLAGLLRKEFDDERADEVFGDANSKKEDAKGSQVIFSNALLLDETGKVAEHLLLEKSPFLQLFDTLPIREHTGIDAKGVTGSSKEFSKFDEEVLYKGARFKFSIEILDDAQESFEKILTLLASTSFRIGGGSTKGFGKIKIIEIKTEHFTQESYLNYSSSLNHPLEGKPKKITASNSQRYRDYTLTIEPEDFFIFGSGFGDNDADATPVYEQCVDYKNAKLTKKEILIPASSVKGALAHRTTYYYNLQNKLFIGNPEARSSIPEIFGENKESKESQGMRGKMLISDCFKDDQEKSKTFDHVSIDRFTGGAKDKALFNEKTIAQRDIWRIEILLHHDVEEKFVKAFEAALDDIKTGMLALGGMTTKGHGVFHTKEEGSVQ